jgi:hypothetical protein
MSTKEILGSLKADLISSVDLYFKPVTAVAKEFRKAICDDDSAPKQPPAPKQPREPVHPVKAGRAA